jgi:translation initiation factor 5B
MQGFNGPIVTKIRALLTPQPMRELRVKAEYIHHQEIKGSMGIKISAPELENALAGSELYRANNEAEVEDYVAQIEDDICDMLDKYIDKTQTGVCVQASTLGSLEALLEFLKVTAKIPVNSIAIGPVHKKDVMKALKALNKGSKNREYASILAFDVKVTPDAAEYAEDNGIKIFTANIIYNLFDDFTDYVKICEEERKKELGSKAVFPCLLEIVPDSVFRSKKPIMLGVQVKSGVLRVGTPLCVPDADKIKIGRVTSMEIQGKEIKQVRHQHGHVAIKIEGYDMVEVGKSFSEKS